MKFFDEVKKQCPGLEIIAEDLGEIDDEVRALLRKTGFPGMGVIQFAFISDDDSTHLPHNYSTKTIGYTGTHDNNTILGWLWESDESSRRYALDYCGFPATGRGRSAQRRYPLNHQNALALVRNMCNCSRAGFVRFRR